MITHSILGSVLGKEHSSALTLRVLFSAHINPLKVICQNVAPLQTKLLAGVPRLHACSGSPQCCPPGSLAHTHTGKGEEQHVLLLMQVHPVTPQLTSCIWYSFILRDQLQIPKHQMKGVSNWGNEIAM